MAKKKTKPKKAFTDLKTGWYKDYDIKWLREVPEHPEYKLVAEYDAKMKGDK